MTELTFLMELFLEDEMPKEIKKKIVQRVKEVEELLCQRGTYNEINVSGPERRSVGRPVQGMPSFDEQAPSMQRLMQANPDLAPRPPQPVTPAAAQALATRQSLMMQGEKPEAGRKGPRKV